MRVLEVPIDGDWSQRQLWELGSLANGVYEGVMDGWRHGWLRMNDDLPDSFRRAERWAAEASKRIRRNADRFTVALTAERLEALEAKRRAALVRIIAAAQR